MLNSRFFPPTCLTLCEGFLLRFFEHTSVSYSAVASQQSGSFPGEWCVNLDMSVCCSSVSATFQFLVNSLQF